MSIADLIKQMFDAGAHLDAVVAAVRFIEEKEEKRKEYERNRKAAWRASRHVPSSPGTIVQSIDREEEKQTTMGSAPEFQTLSILERKKDSQLEKESKKESKVLRVTAGKTLIPGTWLPNGDHYKLGEEKGLTNKEIHEAADEMRSWSLGNGERRSNWDWVFNNWLRRKAAGSNFRNGGFQREKSSKERYGDLLQSLGSGEVRTNVIGFLPKLNPG